MHFWGSSSASARRGSNQCLHRTLFGQWTSPWQAKIISHHIPAFGPLRQWRCFSPWCLIHLLWLVHSKSSSRLQPRQEWITISNDFLWVLYLLFLESKALSKVFPSFFWSLRFVCTTSNCRFFRAYAYQNWLYC